MIKKGKQFPETEYYQHDFKPSDEEYTDTGAIASLSEGGSTFSGFEGKEEGAHISVRGAKYTFLPRLPDEHGQYKLFDYTPPSLASLGKTPGASPATVANVLAMAKRHYPDLEPPAPQNINPMSSKIIKTAVDRGFVTLPENSYDYFNSAREHWENSISENLGKPIVGFTRSRDKANKSLLKKAEKWGKDLVMTAYETTNRYKELGLLGSKRGDYRQVPTEQVQQGRRRLIEDVASKRNEVSNAQEQAFAEYDKNKTKNQGETNLFGEPLDTRERM